ncbi:hypothetical protein NLJ89_g7344 [Agrocybe chaxingu]|uniref:Uncharacterized protein n=1 Tax=Agrocybe chaxingu TaxID=84603 RepID=A0A9W8JXJ5_9AGAR|nr:hypothetical protein NLJ89_g7344 [Agrocybe chaxingu]
MAPSTRASSTQNTPNTRSKGPPSTVATPADTPTKRAYTCRQCKRPKKGDHPRSGCPYVNDTASEEEDTPTSTEPLTNALGSMKLGSSTPMRLQTEEDDQAFKRNRRRLSAQPPIVRSESLVSLSTNSSDLVERLATLNDQSEKSNGKVTKVVRWEDTILVTPKKQKSARSPMPGTLIPPTPESSFGSSPSSFTKQESPGVHLATIQATEYSSEGSTSSVAPPSPSPAPRALTRTMSAVERDLFISKLTSETTATIYTIPKADIQSIQEQATTLKFITCTVMNDDPTDPQALLILGREEEAVQNLRKKIEEENRKAGKSKASSPSKAAAFKAAAGGAVIGAVGTFAGLAFS